MRVQVPERMPAGRAQKHAAAVLMPARIAEYVMKVGPHCKRSVISIRATADVAEAARRMLDEQVRFLVAVDEDDGIRRPVGVLTDRDIVRRATAYTEDARPVMVEDVMTREPMVANEADDLSKLIPAMKRAGIRRVPVVNHRGALTGIIAVDDAVGVTRLLDRGLAVVE